MRIHLAFFIKVHSGRITTRRRLRRSFFTGARFSDDEGGAGHRGSD